MPEEAGLRKKVLIIGCLIGGSIGPLIGEKMQMISRVHSTEAFAVGTFPGLRKEALIIRDKYGVPHIKAKSDADAYFAMGYMHAKDRFFQMDYSRRRGSGTLAELIGAGPGDTILSGDINQRNLGIRRAAERSREICPPEYLGLLEAYSAGVNEWLNNNDLPPEYNLLELTKAQVPRWEVLDSLAIAKAVVFNFAYETSDMLNTALLTVYEKAGKTNGFDGAKLFSEDLFGYKPFWPASSISPPHVKSADNNRGAASKFVEQSGRSTGFIKPETISAITAWFHDSTRHSPMEGAEKITGSNCWVIGGSKTINKASLIANDPHLPLAAPAVFYEIHLMVEKALHQPPMNVYGVSFAGVPGVVLGFNENIAWGATTGRFDVTDIYQEQVRIDPNTQLPTATIYRNVPEPVVVIPEKFRLNQVGNRTDDDIIEVPVGKRSSGVVVPQATIIVPRRNNGPLITMPSGPDAESLTALSVQFTGFSPTFELASSFIWARATNVNEFKEGVQRFKVGSLNWCYADVKGNIAYFTSGVIPLREDLQSGKVVGAAPYFVRDGSGVHRHEWVKSNPSSTIGSLPFKILPFAEMPQIVNPPEGFIVTANNDPMGVTFDGDPVNQNRAHGTGIYYLGARFDAGFRAVRITNLLSQRLEPAKGDRKLGLRDMAEIQSDVVMLDAQVFTPYILRAWEAARASNAPAELSDFTQDREMTEAVERLSKWDFSAPTGRNVSRGFANITG